MYQRKKTFHVESAFSDYVQFLKKYYASADSELDFSCLGEEEKVYLDDLHDLFDTLQVTLIGYYRLSQKMENSEPLNGKLGHNENCTCLCDVCFTDTSDMFREVDAIHYLAEKNVEQEREIQELDGMNSCLMKILEEEYNHPMF